MNKIKQYLAEFIGTYFLVFFGCASMILAEISSTYNGAFIPIIWGGVVSIMIYAVGHISGAHFNPAVTIAFTLTRKFNKSKLFGYLIAQFTGALMASFTHKLIFGATNSFGATMLSVDFGIGILIEFILSFVLMFVIISVATDSRAVGELAGLAIGSTVGLCAFVGGPLTNASMNPARSFAPAVFSNSYDSILVYLIVPILGCVCGAFIYEFIKCEQITENNDHGCC